METFRPCPKCGSKNIEFRYELGEQTHIDTLLNRVPCTEWYECNDCGNQGGKTFENCPKDCIDSISAKEKHYVEKGIFTYAYFWWEHQDDYYMGELFS